LLFGKYGVVRLLPYIKQNFQANACKWEMKNTAAKCGAKPVKSDFAKTLFNGLSLKPPFPGSAPRTGFPEI
jgi:hypothetical protein